MKTSNLLFDVAKFTVLTFIIVCAIAIVVNVINNPLIINRAF